MISVLVIIGYGRSGKDTAAEFLRKHTPLRYIGSTSWVALPFMAAHLDQCPQIAWDERHQHRKEWYEYCAYLKRKDPLFLVKICLNKRGTIITGLRERKEVAACIKAKYHVLWIDASERGIKFDPTVRDFDHTIAHSIVNNHGTMEDFENNLRCWAQAQEIWISDDAHRH